jgi:hypothetical protein
MVEESTEGPDWYLSGNIRANTERLDRRRAKTSLAQRAYGYFRDDAVFAELER